ncbi:MAG: hypothetical protein FWE06_07965 [Oscillospiraceae bacterium]|nr:hypothetical protein [Oscillospiraceae bacterium]
MSFDGRVVVGVEIDSEQLRRGLETIAALTKAGGKLALANMHGIGAAVAHVGAGIISMSRESVVAARIAMDGQVRQSGFAQVGVNMSLGVAAGVGAGMPAVAAAGQRVVHNVRTAMMQAARISSPSQVMRDIIGRNLSLGVAAGIADGESEAVRAARQLAQSILSASQEWINNEAFFGRLDTEGQLEAYRELQRVFAAGSAERLRIEREIHTLEQRRLAEVDRARADALAAERQRIGDEAHFGRLDIEGQLAAYRELRNQFAEGTEERRRIEREIHTLEQRRLAEIDRERADAFVEDRQYIADEVRFNQMSLTAQYNAWLDVLSRYGEGTREHEQALRQLREVILSIDNAIDSLNASYDTALARRTQQLVDSFGLFDAPREQGFVESGQIMANLQDQVRLLENWAGNLAELSARGVLDEQLLADLERLGPQSNAQVKALLRMSDEQLERYNALYLERLRIAEAQATEELRGMRESLDRQIEYLMVSSVAAAREAESIGAAMASGIGLGVEKSRDALRDVMLDVIDDIAEEVLDASGWTLLTGMMDKLANQMAMRRRDDWSLFENGEQFLRHTARAMVPTSYNALAAQSAQQPAIQANFTVEATGSTRRLVELLGLELRRVEQLNGGWY